MTLPAKIFVCLGVLLVLSTFQERVEGVRLCGRRLADLLNFICEKHGGFHAPRAKIDVLNKSNKRATIEFLSPVTSRSKVEAAESSFEGEGYSYRNGIVNECCKKPCTLATMVAYCANVQTAEISNLEELPPAIENLPSVTDEDLAEYRLQEEPTTAELLSSNEVMNRPISLANPVAYSSHPNLGLSPRNRRIFIVLSQLQEDEDRPLGEYSF